MNKEVHGFLIADILPFFRYAVCPTNGQNPGIPFYTLAGAEKLYQKAIEDLPWCGVLLLKREFGGMLIVKAYEPSPDAFDNFFLK